MDTRDAVMAGRWPEATDPTLRTHVECCPFCTDVVAVTEALLAEALSSRQEAAPPSSAIVWWRAQMRARQEAARVAERPLTFVHALAIACAVGLLFGFISTSVAWFRGSSSWVGLIYPSIGAVLTGGWMVLPLLALVASLVLAPLALYVIVADE
jgi:hypothetical protein